jgi:hypothetical protein
MISLQRIARLASSPSLDGTNSALLLEEVLGSSRPLPLPARLRLESQGTLGAVALGMGLSRFIDLTYWHSQQTLDLTERLLAHQNEAGSFGSVTATAVATGALLAASQQFGRCADTHAMEIADRSQQAAEAALAWLSEQFTLASASTGWSDQPFHTGSELDEEEEMLWLESTSSPAEWDPIEGAIVLWQLAPHAVARQRLDFEAIFEALEQAGARHDHAVAQLIERAEQALACSAPDRSQLSLAPVLTEAAA